MTPVRVEAVKNISGAAVKNNPVRVPGFLAAVATAEVKKGNTRPDLGLIFSEVPAVTAGVFTRNQVKAAPVQIDLERIVNQKGRAVLVNSGNANACTGPGGLKDARKLSLGISEALSIPDSQIFLASTGVIGQRLPLTRMMKAASSLVESLSPDGLPAVAGAIMTTDTFPKIVAEKISIGRKKAHIVGMAKGAGMMHPDMATMLCFVLTDLSVSPALLDRMLKKSTDQSFNRITVDGDTSTNDLILIMANGLAGNTPLTDPESSKAQAFGRALDGVLLKLAKMIIEDAEGGTKFVTLQIESARTREEAKTLAMTVALSPLVKTALFGQDANWGRILAAMGRSGVPFDPEKVDIYFDEVQIVKNGISKGLKAETLAGAVLKKPALTIRIDLHQGRSKTEVYTSDLSLDYVRINAEYRT
jgi:glutamate N-acetyltransferase / amino-acid N-acetyltransferase